MHTCVKFSIALFRRPDALKRVEGDRPPRRNFDRPPHQEGAGDVAPRRMEWVVKWRVGRGEIRETAVTGG